jgi:catalase
VNAAEPPFEVSGIAARQPYKHPNRDFSQPGELYHKVMTDVDREHLTGNIVSHLKMRIKTSSCGRQESSTKQTKNTVNA